MKQLPPYTIGCKTQITLIFKNIFKAASLSCYIIVTVKILGLLTKQPATLFDKNLPKIIIQIIIQRNCFIILKELNDIFPVEKTFYLKSYIPQLVRVTHSKLNKLS